MLKKIDTAKIDKVLKEKLSIFLDFKFNGILFLFGGALRDIIMNEEPKDFDFVILTQEKDNIKEFIQKYNLDYKFNSFGTYKINYNGIEVDLLSKNDLYNAMQYNIDGLFYDIEQKVFIPFGFNDCFERQTIEELNPRISHPIKERNIERKEKIKSFYKCMVKDGNK